MAQEAKKKRQHYVPKLILRRFSPDERSLTMVVLGTGKRIENASLKEQYYEDYFYGKDGAIEEAFAQLEGKFSDALGDLSCLHLERRHLRSLSIGAVLEL